MIKFALQYFGNSEYFIRWKVPVYSGINCLLEHNITLICVGPCIIVITEE